MTWLIEDFPYWLCQSCDRPAPFKPDDMCTEEKHSEYYAKKLKGMRRAYHGYSH